jgi:nitrogen regulatory protein PII
MYAGQVADVWHERTCSYRGVKYQMSQLRLRVEILVVNEMVVSEILEAINAAAFASSSGLYGSGDLFTAQVDEWVSIRSKSAAFQPGGPLRTSPPK